MKPIQGGKHPQKNTDATAQTMATIFQNIGGGNKFPEPPDFPYTEMLIQLVQPYMATEPDIEELEEKLELGQISWNMAVMKKRDGYLYQNYRDNFLASELDSKTQKLVDNLVKDKETKFGEHDVMFEDCEIIDDKEGRAMVNVVAKSYEQFMQDVFFSAGNEEEDGDYEYEEGDDLHAVPEYVNRSAMAVIPKKPFWDWVKQLGDELPPAVHQKTMYLVKTMNNEGDMGAWLEENYDRLFENELNDWSEDDEQWPTDRSYKLFTEWFNVELCSMVYDVEASVITKI